MTAISARHGSRAKRKKKYQPRLHDVTKEQKGKGKIRRDILTKISVLLKRALARLTIKTKKSNEIYSYIQWCGADTAVIIYSKFLHTVSALAPTSVYLDVEWQYSNLFRLPLVPSEIPQFALSDASYCRILNLERKVSYREKL